MSTIKVNTITTRTGCTMTLGESGKTVALATGASQTGFGRTGTVDWQTGSIKTSTFTATNGEGYFCNTTSGSFTVNLPAGSAGAIVSVQDYNNTFDSNSLTVSPNGSEKINGGSGGVILSTEGEGVTLVYIDSTVGWRSIQDSAFADVGSNFISATGGTITSTPTCRIHTFTSPGTFTVSKTAACASNNIVSYLVVAGGGAGGANHGGGGGAGGFRELKNPATPYTASPLDGYPSSPNRITVTATAFPITVGGGATGATTPSPVQGTNGSNSIFSTITSAGGGGGGGEAPASNPQPPGLAGGSGGGGSNSTAVPEGSGGAGNTPPTSPAQGTAGGNGRTDNASFRDGGGGGGATAAGTRSTGNPPGATGGLGGAGATTSITNTPTAYAGGGGGGRTEPPAAPGGTGGGGDGKLNCGPAGGNGSDNTGGGGGGGGSNRAGGNGGSGIVVIRYKIA